LEHTKVRWAVVDAETSLDSPQEPGCTFCPSNGRVKVIQTSPSGNTIFVQVMVEEDGVYVPAPGAYFVLPVGHYAPADELPFDFWREINWHIRESGITFDNDGVNRTGKGGARITEHLHYWLMQAQPGDPALGLYTLRASYRKAIQDRDASLAQISRRSRPHTW